MFKVAAALLGDRAAAGTPAPSGNSLSIKGTSTSSNNGSGPSRGEGSSTGRGRGRGTGGGRGGGPDRAKGHKDRAHNPMGARPSRGGPSSSTKPTAANAVAQKNEAINVLETWMGTRYNPEARMLDLSAMADDLYLKERGIKPPGHKEARPILGKVICKLAGELKPPVVTISLQSNNLINLDAFETLAKQCPSLRNLSIAENPLKKIGDIRAITSPQTGLQELRELVTTGCPFRVRIIDENGPEGYRQVITGFFPLLRLLDSQSIFSILFDVKKDDIPPTPPIITMPDLKVSTSSSTSSKDISSNGTYDGPIYFPFSMNSNFIDGDASFVNGFLAQFFNLFDTNRSSLAPIFLPTSTFSISTNTTIPPRARNANFQSTLPNQRDLTWKSYSHTVRNIYRVTHLKDRIARLRVGSEQILQGYSEVVKTKHPMNDAKKWTLDSFPMDRGPELGVVLMLTVHGEFEEMPTMGLRSFDRSFVLAPAAPDSNAAKAGWACVVLSDQLNVRIYSGDSAWEPTALPVGAAPTALQIAGSAPLPVSQIAISTPVLTDDAKNALIIQLSNETRLTPEYSRNCLDGNGWDYLRAMNNFREIQAQIPREGYLP